MAKRRSEMPALPARRRDSSKLGGAAAARGKYPWTEWADGAVWEVSPGIDFSCSLTSFQNMASNYARRHGLRVGTRNTGGGTLLIRFTSPDERP